MPVDVADFMLAARPISRAVREFRRIPRPDLDRSGFVTRVRDFIRQGEHDMVIPTDDQTLTALSEHYHDLTDLAYIACPPPEITSLVLNKYATLEIAQKCGLAIPNTKLISNSAQLPELFSSSPFPWVLKPARKEVRLEETKSFTFAEANEVRTRFPTANEFTPAMLLQQHCSGAGVGVGVLMHAGKAVAVFQHQRLKELPYTGGVSVSAIAEEPDSELLEQSLALLRALRWEGPAMVEFKVHAETGEGVLMEVNGRYWGTISLPISAGINFPLYHWQTAHGETPTVPEKYAVSTKWTWTAGHIVRLHGLLMESRRSAPARKEFLRSLMKFPAAIGASGTHSLFRISDPMPPILDVLRTVKFLFLQDLKALFKRLLHRE